MQISTPSFIISLALIAGVWLAVAGAACEADGPAIYQRKIRECSDTATPEHRAWVLTCIKNGNPMSDEEPEDLVNACASTGYALHCPTITACYNRHQSHAREACPGEEW